MAPGRGCRTWWQLAPSGHALIQRERVDRDRADVASQLVVVIRVLAAADDLHQGGARPTQLEGQPANVGFAAVRGADVATFDVAQTPLGLGIAVELLAGATAIGATARSEVVDDLALAVASEAVGGADSFFHS